MIVGRTIASLALLTLIFTVSTDAQVGRSSLATQAAATQNELIEQRIVPHLSYLFEKLVTERRDTTIDGQRAFTGGDRFLPGKIALGLSLVIVNTPQADPRFALYLAGYRDIAEMTVDDPNDTWGIYYYVSALNKLRKAGLLNEAIRPETLKKLQQKLDWRPFVRVPEYTAINLPTNYLGVAFSIARLRMLLGWEDASGSQQLLAKILDHYQRYSGEFGFPRRDRRRWTIRSLQRAADWRDRRATDRDGNGRDASGQGMAAKIGRRRARQPECAWRRIQLWPQHRAVWRYGVPRSLVGRCVFRRADAG